MKKKLVLTITIATVLSAAFVACGTSNGNGAANTENESVAEELTSEEMELEAQYQEAQQLMDDGEYSQASVTFFMLGDYKDSKAKADECFNLKK